MINQTLTSINDVHHLRDKLREACEKNGVVLDQYNENVENILAHLFDVEDYNTLLGMVSSSSHDNTTMNDCERWAREYNGLTVVPPTSSTYGDKKSTIDALESATGIFAVIFAVSPGDPNDSKTSVLILDRMGTTLLPYTQLTLERRPREHEMLDIMLYLAEEELLDRTFFITQRLSDSLEPEALKAYMLSLPHQPIFPAWSEFTSVYSPSMKRLPPSMFQEKEWDALSAKCRHSF